MDNALHLFAKFRPVTGDATLSGLAFGSETFPADFISDCQSGSLPAVSWVNTGFGDSDHPPSPVTWSQSRLEQALTALIRSGLWAKSVVFLTWDENGGFFDHVAPPTAPPGTPGEYLNQAALSQAARTSATTSAGRDTSNQPIGLGFRVPMLVLSPWTRNPDPSGAPIVSSDLFDHTSMLRFVETWASARGHPAPIPDRDPVARRPGLSAWRRATVGDLTSTLGFGSPPDPSSPPALGIALTRIDTRVLSQCVVVGATGLEANALKSVAVDPKVPPTPDIPAQEPFSPGPVRRPAVCVAAAAGPTPTTAPATAASSSDLAPILGIAGGVVAVLGGVLLWIRSRRRRPADPAVPSPGGNPEATSAS
jgi:phospholipase C